METMIDNTSELSEWQCLPDNILLHIFSYLPASSVLQASVTCKCWLRVSHDEFLWKSLFYRHWQIDPNIHMAPGRTSWVQEYKRLYYHTPVIESEVIRQHSDQVLHVSFSHNGKMFATCSKDGYIRVWNALYPVTLKYKEDMKSLTWKYTQFSQFNDSDTLLLVSGVHFGANSTSGEIAVFSLKGEFELQARVINKPYDVFGTWYNDSYLLSGNLHWTGQLQSCSALWLNKASQETESEHESVVMRLYRFHNINASSIRTIMVANCAKETDNNNSVEDIVDCSEALCTQGANMIMENDSRMENDDDARGNHDNPNNSSDVDSCKTDNVCGSRAPKHPVQSVRVYENGAFQTKFIRLDEDENNDRRNGTIEYGQDYRQAQDEMQIILESELTEFRDDRNSSICNNAMVENQSDIIVDTSEDDLDEVMVANQISSLDCLTNVMSTSQTDLIGEERDTAASQLNGLNSVLTSECKPDLSVVCSISDTVVTDSKPVYTLSNEHANSKYETDDSNAGSPFYDEHCLDYCHSGMYADGSVFGTPLQTNYLATRSVHGDKKSTKYCVVGQSDTSTINTENSSHMLSGTDAPSENVGDKYLVFTMGSETYTPHQIGIKRIKSLGKVQGSSSTLRLLPSVADQPPDVENNTYDKVDKIIDMHGHIIGMCFSPDDRYLYVNNRPWPKNYRIENALYPPPIAQEIDIHVIDLLKMKEVGTMHRSHKAYTPNDECFFIFLDVCKDYVASGAEDRHGYIWDRHYGVCLARFPHTDVVNAVAFNPCDTETLITVSDDFSIKVWRSRSRERHVKVDNLPSLCLQS